MNSATHLQDMEIAHRRTLRLALGVSLSLFVSQLISWPLSFIMPLITMVLLLFPIPAPPLKQAAVLILALALPMYLCIALLLPLFETSRMAAILLLILIWFGCFYFSAAGGPAIIGLFMTAGIAMVVAIGSVSTDAMLDIAANLSFGTIAGILFVWLAHALLPDLPGTFAMSRPQQQEKPSTQQAQRGAFRTLMIVFPVVLFCLFSSDSMSYLVLMIKSASMGQQASTDQSRAMGRSLLESTFWGGIAAIICWQLLVIHPSLLLYCLLVALAMLIMGARLFQGAGLHPRGEMWIYALITMLVLLGPSVQDGQMGKDASSAFYFRLYLFGVIAVYGSVAVAVFDAFWRPSGIRQKPKPS
ncbi:MAG: DUF2955 domain-containing protein [Mariprofundaceae bacterium]|nr:DUF2955 domain-containing protein [Mariprofundaceae bacterium]